MKKLTALLTVIVMIATVVNSFNAGTLEADCVEVISVTHDTWSDIYTVKFTKPVHLFRTGWVWLRQKNAADGELQRALGTVSYSGQTVRIGSDEYSDTLQLVFSEAESGFDNSAYGLSIVEYFLDDANKGFVSPEVIRGAGGEMLKGNFESGGLDFCWIPTDGRDKTNRYATHITEGSGQNLKTLDQQIAESGDFYDKIGNGNVWCFMNCDTGRMLTADGQTDFRVYTEDGEGRCSIRSTDGKKYLKFSETGAVSLSDEPFVVVLTCDNEYSRARIILPDAEKTIGDDDAGDSPKAHTAAYYIASRDIRTGWYMTGQGQKLPMRICLVGDSITNGCTPDGPLPKTGCRQKLSEMLVKEYGRVVFVGSTVASHGGDGTGGARTTVDQPFMYRSDGHNGWVVTSHEGYAPANNYGVDTLIRDITGKYSADVVVMMIGINDINQLGLEKIAADTNGVRTEFIKRWRTLADSILNGLPENGRFIVGTVMPYGDSSAFGRYAEYIAEYNKALCKEVNTIADSDKRISIADNYTEIFNLGAEALSSDLLHLSAEGYAKMADCYFRAVTSVCNDITRTVQVYDKGPADSVAEPKKTAAQRGKQQP